MPNRRWTSEYHVTSSDASDDRRQSSACCVMERDARQEMSMKLRMTRRTSVGRGSKKDILASPMMTGGPWLL